MSGCKFINIDRKLVILKVKINQEIIEMSPGLLG